MVQENEVHPGLYQGMRVVFDKHRGFLLSNLTLTHKGDYVCHVRRNGIKVDTDVGNYFIEVHCKLMTGLSMPLIFAC